MKDCVIHDLIHRENDRQRNSVNLIASENICWPEVCEIMSSCLTNKYAEGVPGARYYAGCAVIDEIELIAQSRCNELFGSEYCNIQPHAGTQANLAAYKALLSPGDAILAMDFAAGGHLSHGHRASITSILYRSVSYGVDKKNEYICYDTLLEIAKREKPRLIIAGASSYSRHIDYQKMRDIADEVGAYLMADIAHVAGIIAAGLHPSPVLYADVVTATTHKTLRGPRGAFIMCKQKYAEKIDRAVMPGVQGGPFMHAIAAKAVAFEYAKQQFFFDYQKKILDFASFFADFFIENGMRVISGGTDNHLFVIDTLSSIGMNGFDVEKLLEKNNIIVNRNSIPYDSLPPRLSSGIRIGTSFIAAQEYTKEDLLVLGERIMKIFLQK